MTSISEIFTFLTKILRQVYPCVLGYFFTNYLIFSRTMRIYHVLDSDLSDEEVVGDIEHHPARYCALWWKCGVYNPMMISAIRLTKIRAIHLGLLRRREFKAPNASCRQLVLGSRWSMSYLQVFLDLNANIDQFVVNQSDSASSCG